VRRGEVEIMYRPENPFVLELWQRDSSVLPRYGPAIVT
jgi:hypothetical protein